MTTEAPRPEVYEVRDVRAFVVDGVLVVWNVLTREAACTCGRDACTHVAEVYRVARREIMGTYG